jgi:hypothetical protein
MPRHPDWVSWPAGPAICWPDELGRLKPAGIFADNKVMDERRAESRMLCADMVDLCWSDPAGRARRSTALLEDISVHGACLQLEFELPLGTDVSIEHARMRMRGTVRYCVYREIGYFLGVEFEKGSEWSRSQFTPEHLLDLEQLVLRRAKRTKRVN